MSVNLEAGQQIKSPWGSYTLIKLAGSGGFGQTFEAVDAVSSERVALKVLRMERLEDWKSLELFWREAGALKSLSHPAIPAFLGLFWFDGERSYAIEASEQMSDAPKGALILAQRFIEGQTLAERIARGLRCTEAEALRILRESLHILDYLHSQHPPVIHRDVTPKNLLLDASGRVCLVDFGAISQGLLQETVGGSTTVGTLGYIPIEQSVGKARPASDLYALGVTMVSLLTGKSPEQLPMDEATSKLDLKAAGLEASSPDGARLISAIDAMIEPLLSARPQRAKDALGLLEGTTQLAINAATTRAVTTQEHAQPAKGRNLFWMCLGGSIGSALILYPIGFDRFSETLLVQLSPLWIGPAAFGIVGLTLGKNAKRPYLVAVVGALVVLFLLAVFFVVIWPSL